MNKTRVSTPIVTPNPSALNALRPRTSEIIAPIMLLCVFSASVLFRPSGTDLVGYSWDLAEAVVRNGTGRALLAIGAGLVLASAGVDLSMVGVLALSGVLFAWAVQYIPIATAYTFFFVLFIGVLCTFLGSAIGGFNGWAIGKWKAPSLILTWAVGAIALIFSAVLAELLPHPANISVAKADSSGIPIVGSVAVAIAKTRTLTVALGFLFIVLPTFLGAFNLGRNARAIGANRISATYAGIRVKRTLVATYTTSAAFAAMAGIWFALLERKALTTSYAGVELSAIAIAVLGGTAMTGGYFSVIPIACAAFLWSLLLSVLQRPDLLPNFFTAPLQSRAAEATFATLLIMVGLWVGRRLSGDTVAINVISRLEEE